MTQEEFLRKLLSPTPRSKREGGGPSKYAWVRDIDGQLVKVPLAEAKAMDIGSFQGKVGTIRRSNKGTPRRMPNGSRRFVRSWRSRNKLHDRTEVVSYKA